MIKICSLDFLNKKFFETDVKTEDGIVLVYSGEKITPETILKLYYREIYVDQPLEEETPIEESSLTSENQNIETGQNIKEEQEEQEIQEWEDLIEDSKIEESEQQAIEEQTDSKKVAQEELYLTFDEELAKRIVKMSVALGKELEYSDNELKVLEQVAYYSNIGVTSLTKSDMEKSDFRQRKILAGYEKLKDEKIVKIEIAEAVKSCAKYYEVESFQLNSKIPYADIVVMINYYEDLLLKGLSKQAALLKMLQMGANNFNTFVLHKFIRIMRDTND